jgi:hypothetical protein
MPSDDVQSTSSASLDVLVEHHQSTRPFDAADAVGVEAGRARALVLGRQQQRRVGRQVLGFRIGRDVPQHGLLGAAESVGQARRLPAAHRHEPEVVPVVEHDRGVVIGPACDAVVARRRRLIVQFVVEAHAELGRQDAFGQIREIQRTELLRIVEPDQVPTTG